MDLSSHQYRVLTVSSSEKLHRSLVSMLSPDLYSLADNATGAFMARRLLLERSYDIVIINTPLSDEFGTELAMDLCEKSTAGVLLLVRQELFADISGRVSPFGVLTLSKPTNGPILTQSLQLLCATRERLRRMEQKTATLEEKMADIRLVNKAKWLLIEHEGMSEQQAHRYIEKTAMDRSMTKRAVAENILKTY